MINLKLVNIKKPFFAVIIISLFLINSCLSQNSKEKENINKFILFYNVPIVKLNGDLQNITDTLIIYTKNDLSLYALPYNYSIDDGNKLTLEETRFRYFIFRANEPFGYYFDSLYSQNPLKMNVDSLLKEKAFTATNYYDRINDSLIIKIQNQDNIPLIEKYIPKTKHDNSYADTTIFYYSKKLKNLDYSFSKDLEKERTLRISKVQMVFNNYFDKLYNIELPEREFSFELSECLVKNEDEVLSFFTFLENTF